MSELSVADIIKGIRDLPPLPAVVVDLMNNLDSDETGARLLADKIVQDQALTAKTLRLANSSFYGMQRKVATIHQAIAIIGFDSVRTIVTAAAVIDRFSGGGNGMFDFNKFWQHSLGTAVCARAIASHAHLNPDQGFIVGLLHDIGILVLVSHSAPSYQQVLARRHEQDCALLEAERTMLGIDHARVGRALAEHWKFPPAIQRAIETHHAPARQDTDLLAAVVHVADAIAHGLDLGGEEDDMVPPISPDAWNSLALDKDFLMRLFRDVETQTDEVYRAMVAA